MVDRLRVGFNGSGNGQVAAGKHHGHAVISNWARQQNPVPHLWLLCQPPGGNHTHPCGGDVHLVTGTLRNHLGVPGNNAHPGTLSGGAHRLGLVAQFRDGQPLFQNECHGNNRRFRTRDCEIVHRSVDREFTDAATGKVNGVDHVRIGGKRQGRGVGTRSTTRCGASSSQVRQRKHRRIPARIQHLIAVTVVEHVLHQRRRCFAAGAVGEGHIIVCEAERPRTHTIDICVDGIFVVVEAILRIHVNTW